ncbi:hypothetical protein JJB07_01390 [Tumebacillus sp. ITR2]|uniref:Uncharacterized protein n=1 Tax=Tumebacillus amylolyticus TaxID=2801339 RepID=A0ABS1J4U8_9BACL|nr:hypothetical protein [Tumebacillus amylolyticus]MBL0385286.1 hypothetical protein [Tumebacillus amylolyticus]
MLESLALIFCFFMIAYGYIRYLIALARRQENPVVHALWMPAAAFVYAAMLAFDTWIF